MYTSLFFTFHNVSINTEDGSMKSLRVTTLHSTMFLLIQTELKEIDKLLKPLHSTMFLLILISPWSWEGGCLFTFHNVSINTKDSSGLVSQDTTLHSTMFLLILRELCIVAVAVNLYIPQCFY